MTETQQVFCVSRGSEKCGGCNYKTHTKYLIAPTKQKAEEWYDEEGGLCGECLIEIIKENYYLTKEKPDEMEQLWKQEQKRRQR